MHGSKRIIVLAMALCMLMSFSLQSVFAASSDFDDLTGTEKSGKVKISVESYREVDGMLVHMPELVKIKAGDFTSYIPIITNKGSECSMRLRIYANTETQKINILKYCCGWEDKWTMKDDWFYYKKDFEKGESVQICQGFEFPDEWQWKVSNVMSITVEAEAVADEETSGSTVQTGDDFNMKLWTAIGIASLGMILVIGRRKHDTENL